LFRLKSSALPGSLFRKMTRIQLFCVAGALLLPAAQIAVAQMGTSTPLPAAEAEKAAKERLVTDPLPDYPRLVDITDTSGIHFDHLSSPESKYIAESMSGGVVMIDYDRDGWPRALAFRAGLWEPLWATTTMTAGPTCW